MAGDRCLQQNLPKYFSVNQQNKPKNAVKSVV